MFLESTKACCPYCGELIEFLFEPLDTEQEYFEDCQVCCQPILIKITSNDGVENIIFNCFRADETG